MVAKKKEKDFGGAERRKSMRRPVVESFSFFVAIPRKGGYRLPIQDVSEDGMAFSLDTEGETAADFPIASGEEMEVHFYLNQSLYLPLSVKLVRVLEIDGIRRAGALFVDKKSKGYQALRSLIALLDEISDTARLTGGASNG